MRGKRRFGEIGENNAVELLESKGYKIIERNFRCKIGEIDIVAVEGDTLVFIEVKTRWSNKFGNPEEAVTTRKLAKIKKVISYYTLIHKNLPKKQRIDVVAIEMVKGVIKSSKIIKVL